MHRQFEHPNLMPVLDWAFYDVTNQGTAAFMLLPYISGGTLRSFLDAVLLSGKRLAEHDVLVMFQGVCRGVAQLHAAQLCHSDIKAGNQHCSSRSLLGLIVSTKARVIYIIV
jgi:eukaryotic-like serine/threonine-protein kinase